MKALVACLVTAMAMPGCGVVVKRPLSLDDCRAGNWREIGLSDGLQGFLAGSRLADFTEACGIIRVAPDQTEYTRGYEKGRREYCREAGLFYEGVYGNAYLGACNDLASSAALLSAYREGLRFAKRRKDTQVARDAVLARLESGQGTTVDAARLSELRAQLDRIEDEADAAALDYLR